MAPIRWATLLVLAVLFAAMPLAASAAPAPIPAAQATQATLTVLADGVQIVGSGGAQAAATNGQALAAGDRVITSASGRAILTFADGSQTELQPGTELVVQDLRTGDSGNLFVQLTL